MVLSDRTIARLLEEGRIEIDPYDDSLLQPSSVDVRVDRYFRVFHNNRYPYIDVREEQEDLTELVEVEEDTPFVLHPGEFVLGSTLERVRLPDDLVARLEGKSSLGRLGLLIHSTAGFIDGHVVHELRGRDLPVRALVRDRRKGAKLAAWGTELAEGDMTDTASLSRAVAGCETVVHLVAIRQGREEQFRRVMVEGTRDLLAAAKDAGVARFVHMSALGTSEATKDLVPYYRAKWEMEQQVQASGIPYVVFRPSFIFAGDGGTLPTFVKLARLAPVTPIIGSGRQRIQPIWAHDVAAYFAEGIRRDDVLNGLFELGGPEAVNWNEL